jgi:HEPN domain-containing protein
MTPAVREWVKKAEADLATGRRELRVRRAPNFDAVCFHAQQAAEKYIKAELQHVGATYPKTHDLVALLDRLGASHPLQLWRSQLRVLSAYAVAYRYPGAAASRENAKGALQVARQVRKTARMSLGLGP